MNLGKLNNFVIHFVGNKKNGDGVKFSNSTTEFDMIHDFMLQLIKKNFKFDKLYNFHFNPSLDLNPVYQFVNEIFENTEGFIEQSKNIARFLYDKSSHPQIKSGELCLLYFKDCILKGKTLDAIGLFKSENKDTFLEIERLTNGFAIDSKKGININKLDKGCLIFNTQKENGYLVSIVDNTNRLDAQYWKDDFLSIQPVKNEFHRTNQFLDITKHFLTKQMPAEFSFSKADQIDLLNRSVEYFKTHEIFNKQEFEEEAFKDNSVIESFRNFSQSYQQENDIALPQDFKISSQAVKKQARAFKRVLKLDKNFHIYIHGDRNLIEQGIDEKGRKFYKFFYEKEK